MRAEASVKTDNAPRGSKAHSRGGQGTSDSHGCSCDAFGVTPPTQMNELPFEREWS
jgi:hypothetical protein